MTNITILKQFLTYTPIKKEVIKWLKTDSRKKKVIILYTASEAFLRIAKYVKAHYKAVQTCCIIADLPEYSSTRDLKGIRRIYNDFQTWKCKNLYRFVDKFVLLTEAMAAKLEIESPYIVMEGIASSNDNVCIDEAPLNIYDNTKYILYSGTLNYEFGIGILLKAFSLLKDKDVYLLICGVGEAEDAIRRCQDNRIIYLGKIDRRQVMLLQKNAIVLVNPRQNNHEFTKYSFPSKTMEYLASGTPVVAYKLDGIPDEYDQFINYVPDNSIESLARILTEICEKPESWRKEMGTRAREFVLQNKNSIVQTKKILALIRK